MILKASYSGATEFVYGLDKAPDTIPTKTSGTTVVGSTINLGGKADGAYWFHVRGKTSSGLSDVAHYELKVDKTVPGRPANPSGVPKEDGTVFLEWGSPELEDLSGIAGYNIFRSTSKSVKDALTGAVREFTIQDGFVKKIATGHKDTTYIDKEVEVGKGKVYFYKVQAVDNAANGGVPSLAVTVRTTSLCDLKLTLDTNLGKDANLGVRVGSSAVFDKGHLTITGPDREEAVLIEKLSNASSAQAYYLLGSKVNGDYNVFFTGNDDEGDACRVQKTFVYDTVNPELKVISPDTSKPLTEIVRFQLTPTDTGVNPSGISSVSIFVKSDKGETKVGDANKQGNDFVFDWNSVNHPNGRFTIIVRAFDRGGNKAEAENIYTIQNTVLIKASATSSIDAAEEKKKDALEHVKALEKRNIPVKDLNSVFVAADSNMSYARQLVEKEQFLEIADKSAKDAASLYQSIPLKVKFEVYNTAPYEYKEAQLDVLLKSAGVEGQKVSEATSLIKKFSPSRRLEILKVTRGDSNSTYKANIVISLKAPDRNSSVVNVVEVIPKKFVDGASKISSTFKFEVLENDPTIVFKDVNVDGNSTVNVELAYSFSQDLTKEQADVLLKSSPMDLYVSPPIITAQSSALIVAKPVPKLALPELPKSLGGNNTIIIAGILVVLFVLFMVFVVGAVAIWYFFFRKKEVKKK